MSATATVPPSLPIPPSVLYNPDNLVRSANGAASSTQLDLNSDFNFQTLSPLDIQYPTHTHTPNHSHSNNNNHPTTTISKSSTVPTATMTVTVTVTAKNSHINSSSINLMTESKFESEFHLCKLNNGDTTPKNTLVNLHDHNESDNDNLVSNCDSDLKWENLPIVPGGATVIANIQPQSIVQAKSNSDNEVNIAGNSIPVPNHQSPTSPASSKTSFLTQSQSHLSSLLSYLVHQQLEMDAQIATALFLPKLQVEQQYRKKQQSFQPSYIQPAYMRTLPSEGLRTKQCGHTCELLNHRIPCCQCADHRQSQRYKGKVDAMQKQYIMYEKRYIDGVGHRSQRVFTYQNYCPHCAERMSEERLLADIKKQIDNEYIRRGDSHLVHHIVPAAVPVNNSNKRSKYAATVVQPQSKKARAAKQKENKMAGLGFEPSAPIEEGPLSLEVAFQPHPGLQLVQQMQSLIPISAAVAGATVIEYDLDSQLSSALSFEVADLSMELDMLIPDLQSIILSYLVADAWKWKTCQHACTLRYTKQCCQCLDQRPKHRKENGMATNLVYEARYADGRRNVMQLCPAHEHYCPTCYSRCEKEEHLASKGGKSKLAQLCTILCAL